MDPFGQNEPHLAGGGISQGLLQGSRPITGLSREYIFIDMQEFRLPPAFSIGSDAVLADYRGVTRKTRSIYAEKSTFRARSSMKFISLMTGKAATPRPSTGFR
jgi:hypothetical protein